MRPRPGAPWLAADLMRRRVQFLVQRALFLAAQTATMLGRHIAFFLFDGRELLMQTRSDGRRVVALGDMRVDAVRFVFDALLHLFCAMQSGDMRVGQGLRSRRGHNAGA